MKFSIVTVTYNSGNKLIETISSCLAQSYSDYEIIIKDGLSDDVLLLKSRVFDDDRISVFSQKDDGIYDAMNQAIHKCKGDFIIFMNSGDKFYDETVLEKVALQIELDNSSSDIYYGDCYVRSRNGIVRLPKVWNDYCCYRYTICHQAMFYKRQLLMEMPFDTDCSISACIVHYIYAFARDKRVLTHVNCVIVDYEGGGISDTSEGHKKSLRAQNIALKKCYGKKNLYFKIRMFLNGQLIKQKISTVPLFQNMYEMVAGYIYSRRK